MFCPDRQQYNNTKPFPAFVGATEDLTIMNNLCHMNLEYVPDAFTSE